MSTSTSASCERALSLLSFIAPLSLLLVGFVVSVAAGAARDADSLSPVSALAALLTAAALLGLQALLWVRLVMLL